MFNVYGYLLFDHTCMMAFTTSCVLHLWYSYVKKFDVICMWNDIIGYSSGKMCSLLL